MPTWRSALVISSIWWLGFGSAIPTANLATADQLATKTTTASDAIDGVVRSGQQLREARKQDLHKPLRVDLEASLTFVSRFREQGIFQDQWASLFVRLTESQARAIEKHSVGARFHIVGTVAPESWAIKPESIVVVDASAKLEPADAKIRLSTRGTPLNRFAFTEVEVQEVQVNPRGVLLYAKQANASVEIWCASPLSFAQAAALPGSTIRVEGVVQRNEKREGFPTLSNAVHRMLLMNQDGLRVLKSARPETEQGSQSSEHDDETTPALSITGTVVFSSGDNRIGLIADGRRYLVRTEFAAKLKPGKTVTAHGRVAWNHRQDLVVLTSHVLQVHGGWCAELPTVVPTTSLEILSRSRLPPRVKIRGIVQYARYHASTCEIIVRDGPKECVAVIPTRNVAGKISPTVYEPGTSISFIGMPIRSQFSAPLSSVDEDDATGAKNAMQLRLLVGSLEDVVIEGRPLHLSLRSFAVLGFVALAAFVGAIFWNQLLRCEVNHRTLKLNAATSHLQSAFDAVREAVVVTDAKGFVCRSNQRLEQVFGIAPKIGEPIETWIDSFAKQVREPEVLQWLKFEAGRDSGLSRVREFRLCDPDRTVQLYINGIGESENTSEGRLWVFEDMTERRRMELELLQAQKMEAIGQLSGGIAHDFNNFLTVIRSSLVMLRMRQTRIPDAAEDYVAVADMAVDRAAELTEQLLDFARLSRLECRPVRVNQILDQVERLLGHSCGEKVRLQVLPCPQDALVMVDSNRIQQAVINLCLNGRDAMRDQGGTLTLAAECVVDAAVGSAVCLSVTDEGPGIEEGERKQIFEPFFTTKEMGEGTGLGLSVAQGVVQQHGGRIDVCSAVPHGTRFEVFLPRVNSAALALVDSAHNRNAATIPSDQDALLRVLLVDDDTLVRESAARLLMACGHRVETAANGMQAIHKLAAHGRFDVVLLDLTMPEMSGLETYHEILSAWPEQKVVFCSGYSNESINLDGLDAVSRPPLLKKPFRLTDLQSVLQRATGQLETDTTAVITVAPTPGAPRRKIALPRRN